MSRSWRHDSEVMSFSCPFRGPAFNSHHQYSGLQLPETPVTVELMFSSEVHGDQVHI